MTRFDQAASIRDEDPGRVRLARTVVERMLRRLGQSSHLDVLDFGCGKGLLTLALQPQVRGVTGETICACRLAVC